MISIVLSWSSGSGPGQVARPGGPGQV